MVKNAKKILQLGSQSQSYSVYLRVTLTSMVYNFKACDVGFLSPFP